MNTNLIHNILNVLIAIAAAASLPEVLNILPAEIAVTVAGIAATMKIVINVIRDGVTGLAKKQPPVQ